MPQYSNKLLNYFYHTPHAGSLNPQEPNVIVAKAGEKSNNELLELYLQIADNKIICARFKASGSPSLIASAEFVCDWLEGKKIEEVAQLNPEMILQFLELPKTQIHTALLLHSALLQIASA